MTEPSDDWIALLGVKGGPAIRPGSHMPTSTLLRLGGRTILVDAGLGAARGVCDQGVPLTAIDLVLVTHLHSDHCLELGPLLHTAWTAGLARPVPVIGPPGLAALWDGFLASMAFDVDLRVADEGRVPLRPLAAIRPIADGVIHRDGDLAIRAIRNHHPPVADSFALRFETPGRAVVLSGDTAPFAGWDDFVRDADLLVHEAMLPAGVDAVVARLPSEGDRLGAHILRSHTDAAEVGALATRAGVGHLVLNHFVPDGLPGFDNATWESAVRAAWTGPLTLGRDGIRLPL